MSETTQSKKRKADNVVSELQRGIFSKINASYETATIDQLRIIELILDGKVPWLKICRTCSFLTLDWDKDNMQILQVSDSGEEAFICENCVCNCESCHLNYSKLMEHKHKTCAKDKEVAEEK